MAYFLSQRFVAGFRRLPRPFALVGKGAGLGFNKYRTLFLSAIVLFTVLGQGCSYFPIWRYGPDRQTRKDFEHRVEVAFKLQNHVSSVVMDMQASGAEGAGQDAVLQAEQLMQKQCAYLNEYAAKEIDGDNTGFLLLRQVENSVADCEQAAHRADEMLKDR